MKLRTGPLLEPLLYLLGKHANERVLDSMLMPFDKALNEIHRRQNDHKLRKKVEEYLQNDIPEHFKGEPILYLARQVATPNFETLRFLHLVEPVELKAVISQDIKDRFVSRNQLKRALGKMPIVQRIVRNGTGYSEQYENLSIIEFNKSDGESFRSIKTRWGENLVDFHNRALAGISTASVMIVDDSEWIDRHYRGELLDHYKKFLALFLVHGIMFEDYPVLDSEEQRFVQEILYPAYMFIKKKFGVSPLITPLLPTSVESPKFWISYPSSVRTFIQS